MKRWLAALFVVLLASPAFAQGDDPMYACHPSTGKIRAYFKPDAELKDVVTWLMGFTCKNIVIGAGVDVTTKITLITPNEMTSKQALKLFDTAVDAAGYAVTDKGDTLVIKLTPGAARPCPGTPTAPTTLSPTKVVDATPPADDTDLDKLLATGIKKIDDTHYELSNQVLEAVLANPMALSKGARVVPYMKDGKVVGFKLYAIRPSSFFARIGLVNGDALEMIQGDELTSPDKALEVYARVRDATSLEVVIERRGKQQTLYYKLK